MHTHPSPSSDASVSTPEHPSESDQLSFDGSELGLEHDSPPQNSSSNESSALNEKIALLTAELDLFKSRSSQEAELKQRIKTLSLDLAQSKKKSAKIQKGYNELLKLVPQKETRGYWLRPQKNSGK